LQIFSENLRTPATFSIEPFEGATFIIFLNIIFYDKKEK